MNQNQVICFFFHFVCYFITHLINLGATCAWVTLASFLIHNVTFNYYNTIDVFFNAIYINSSNNLEYKTCFLVQNHSHTSNFFLLLVFYLC